MYTCVIVYMVHVPMVYMTHDTGWRGLIGSPKLQIIFNKRATKYRALLQKITNKDKTSYGSSPPCVYVQYQYGEASVSRIDEITGQVCKRALLKETIFCKRDLNFIDPTNRSHSIVQCDI